MRSTKSSCYYKGKIHFPILLYPSLKNRWQANISWFGFNTNTVRDIMAKSKNRYKTDRDYQKMWEEVD